MPKVVVYVPAGMYRQLEEYAGPNGYPSAADVVRAHALMACDELLGQWGPLSERAGRANPVSHVTRGGVAETRAGSRSESDFKPDFKKK